MRLELLKEVERLKVPGLGLQLPLVVTIVFPPPLSKESFGVAGDVAYTCETAGHFYLYQVLSRWEQFVAKVKPLASKVCTQCCLHMSVEGVF